MQRWVKGLRPGLVKGRWSADEDSLLLSLVTNGKLSWTAIAERIPGRTSKQCRERWFNFLDPSLKHGSYSVEEDEKLWKLHCELGGRWAKIAKLMPGRSENSVKVRCNALRRQKNVGPLKRSRSESSEDDEDQSEDSSINHQEGTTDTEDHIQLVIPEVKVEAVAAASPNKRKVSTKSTKRQKAVVGNESCDFTPVPSVIDNDVNNVPLFENFDFPMTVMAPELTAQPNFPVYGSQEIGPIWFIPQHQLQSMTPFYPNHTNGPVMMIPAELLATHGFNLPFGAAPAFFPQPNGIAQPTMPTLFVNPCNEFPLSEFNDFPCDDVDFSLVFDTLNNLGDGVEA